MITDRELRAVIVIVEHEAERAGRPWHPQGLHSQLRLMAHDEPDRPLDELVSQACQAARDPAAQTPAAIGWPRYRPRRPDAPAPARCIICNLPGADACAHAQAMVAPEHRHTHPYTPPR